MNRIIKALSEPSTYAGFSALALSLGIAEEEYTAISAALAAVFAAVAVYLKEDKSA